MSKYLFRISLMMKKVALLLLATIFATSAFAQEWSAGLRVGSGIQAVGQYRYNGKDYFEARFGGSWNNMLHTIYYNDGTVDASRVMADFTIMHNWHLLDMDWTPNGGSWFVDAGVGVNVGGRQHYAYVGALGSARLGFTFFDVPLTLTLDWSPTFGPAILYAGGQSTARFNDLGLANIGISCVYNF